MNKSVKKLAPFNRTGFLFPFDLGNNEILVYVSAMSGMEYIYTNGKLISKKWSFKRTSSHVFILDDDHYEVLIHVLMLKGLTECTLFKDDEKVEKYKASYKYKHITPLIIFVIMFFIGFLFGVLVAYNNWSYWGLLLISLLVPLLVLYHMARNTVIERIQV